MTDSQRITSVADIEQALTFIPADDRDVWVQVGMAIQSELGDAGFGIWNIWSQSAGNYNERDARDVWRSFKQGSIRIGTLFYHARSNGWRGGQRVNVEPTRTNVEPIRSIEKQSTGAYAIKLWLRADKSDSAVTKHLYAISKGIPSAGGAGRSIASGKIIGKDVDCIVVPVRNIQTDKVQGVQCINTKGAKQSFGTLSGGGLLLGNTMDVSLPWYVCEGWASAYSMVFHHLDGNAVAAVSFGKTNLDKVAHAIAEYYQPGEISILREVDA